MDRKKFVWESANGAAIGLDSTAWFGDRSEEYQVL
jgi:hypothetical protein